QGLFENIPGLFTEGCSLGVGAQGLVQHSQVVQAGGIVAVLDAVGLFTDVPRHFINGFGLTVGAHVLVQHGQVVQALGIMGVLDAQDFFANVSGLFQEA